MLFIAFDILDEQKFKDFAALYEVIRQVHYSERPKPIEFWVDLVPDYSRVFFNVVAYEAPGYDQSKMDFNMIMDYLQVNIEVDYKDCVETSQGKGRLEFLPLAYPYGGMDRLMIFLKTFDCVATRIASGFGLKTVSWHEVLDFSCQDI